MSTVNQANDEPASLTEEPEAAPRQMSADERRAHTLAIASPLDRAFLERQRGSPKRYESQLRDERQDSRPSAMYMSGNITETPAYADHGNFVHEAVAALEAMHSALTSVIAAREKSKLDPALPVEAMQVIRVGEFADKHMGAVSKAQHAYEKIGERIKEAEAELRKGITSDSSHLTHQAGQIREHCARLSRAERSELITSLIEENDTESLGAIFKSKAFLSGLSTVEADHFVHLYNKTYKPQLPARIEFLKNVYEQLERTGAQFTQQMESAMGVKWGTVHRLRQQAAAAAFG